MFSVLIYYDMSPQWRRGCSLSKELPLGQEVEPTALQRDHEGP